MDDPGAEFKGRRGTDRKTQRIYPAVANRMKRAGGTVNAHHLPGVAAALLNDRFLPRPDAPECRKPVLWRFLFQLFVLGAAEDGIGKRAPVFLRANTLQEQPTLPSSLIINAMSSSEWLRLNHSGKSPAKGLPVRCE